MPKPIQVLPAEDSAKKTPSVRVYPSDPATLQSSRISNAAPSLSVPPSNPAPSLSVPPSNPAPSLSVPPSHPAPSLSGRTSNPATPQSSRLSNAAPSLSVPPSHPATPLKGRLSNAAPSLSVPPSHPAPPRSGRTSNPATPQSSRLSNAAPSLSGPPLDPAPPLKGHLSNAAPSLSVPPSDPAPPLSGHSASSEVKPSMQPASSKRSPLEPESSLAPGSQTPGPGRKFLDVTVDWFCATTAFLFICAILSPLVFIMYPQVTLLSKTSEAENEVIQVRILLLTEILQHLQIGKVLRCSVCQIQWLQYADNCYLFKRRQMSWMSSMGFCKDESSSLPVINSTEEMDFLKLESKKYLHLHRGRLRFNKFWIGLKYERSIGKWVWIDGSVLKVKRQEEESPNSCMYLQNGEFHSQECSEAAYVLCKAKVQPGWN